MPSEITDQTLRDIMPNLPAAKREIYLPFINEAMREFEISTYLRAAAFLAQLAHESAELRYFQELASGAAYEGRADLGNTHPGDGRKYKGHGPIKSLGDFTSGTSSPGASSSIATNPAVSGSIFVRGEVFAYQQMAVEAVSLAGVHRPGRFTP